jgi:hypothetical protein
MSGMNAGGAACVHARHVEPTVIYFGSPALCKASKR